MMQLLIFISSYFLVYLRVLRPGGIKAIIAENKLLRQQLIIANRGHKRSPHLTFFDRLCLAFLVGLLSPKRLLKSAIIIKPSTLFKIHSALVKRKYRLLFSNKSNKKPGRPAPPQEVITAVMQMKTRNPRFGCRRIAMQVSLTFGLDLNKDVVYRILAKYYKPQSGGDGASWLTFIGHAKDSLWSLDFFRVESIALKSHWIMVVMDQFTRKIIGFAVHNGDLDGVSVCTMFNKIISGKHFPKYLSGDNDPLFQFHRWRANLRILDIDEIKTVPYVPISHPFVERLIKSIRNELTDRILFYRSSDLQYKLEQYQNYFNENRTHMGLKGNIPIHAQNNTTKKVINIRQYHWKQHCRGLFNLPMAA